MPSELALIVAGSLAAASSGMPGLLLSRRSAAGQRIAVLSMSSGCGLALVSALGALVKGSRQSMQFPGVLPEWGFQLVLDPLSAFFLVPIFLLGILCPIYGLRYWRQANHVRNGRKLSLCYGLLVAGLGMVAISGDGITFLFAWEIMALSAFFLVSTEDHKPEAQRAGWIYLVATHIGTLCLFALFALLRLATGSFELRRVEAADAGVGFQTCIFLVGLMGFGLKAGMMPLHFWLPGAHASAPSHVSAMLSGVLLKIGIYGLLRLTMILSDLPLSCGVLVLIFGAISALLGVAFALGQHDLKRLLAYHSIENVGIILLGLGLAMVGQASGARELVVLGLAGCLLHVWNHGLFKSLLFLAAGSVVHATHTRDIDRLGGLAKSMPGTAVLFAVGAIAICGLPPLNGFVSEFIIYLGLFRAVVDGSATLAAAALAAPVLAMVGGLAVACFVKAFGAVFLGIPRTPAASAARETGVAMLAPSVLLALLCAVIGLFPVLVLPLLDRVIVEWSGSGEPLVASLVPYPWITALALGVLLLVGIALAMLRHAARSRPSVTSLTWDCGYALPSSSMQYTSSSFASILVGLLDWVLRPVTHLTPPRGLLPRPASYESHVPDVVLDGMLQPFWRRIRSWLSALTMMQQGRVQVYLAYLLIALVVLLLTMVPLGDLYRRLLGL